MRLVRAGIAVVVLTLVGPSNLQAQVSANDLGSTLSNIRQQTLNAQGVAALQPQLMRTRTAVEWLTNRIAGTNLAEVTPEYLRSLERVADVARNASPDQWEDIASELEAKVEHCRTLGIGMGGSVLVKIDTRRASAPVGDWQVFYLLKIYESVNGASPTNFPKLSTPTQAPIEPGRYWIWARDPATGKTSDRVLVRAVGQKELLVDLPVP